MLPKVFTALVICFLCLLSPQDRATETKPLYLPTGQEAALWGTVTVDGDTLPPREIDMFADLACVKMSQHGLTEFVVRNGDKLQNVFVYFKSGEPLNQYKFDQPTTPAVLQQKNCFYRPRALGIRVNQSLHIENNDPTTHNVHPTPKINREWNYSHMPDSAPLIKTFDSAEVAIPFKCNQHPWEKAWVGVFDHPFFAVSNMFGRYEIRGIPPGTYKLVAWHETLGEQEIEITLVPFEVRNMEFIFSGNAKR